MGDTLLKIEGLNKSFGITHANVNVNLELGRGEIRGLAGENGSGKSTLLSQIAGIYRSDSGKMILNGEEYCHGGAGAWHGRLPASQRQYLSG